MNKSVKRNVIVSAMLSIALCVSLVAGATFALFTSESKVNIAVTSGKVKVVASVKDFEAYSPTAISVDGENVITDATNAANNSDDVKLFANGGTATLNTNAATNTVSVTLTNVTPGDKVTFSLDVVNYSNVSIKYRVVVSKAEGSDELFDKLAFKVGERTSAGASLWTPVAGAAEESGSVTETAECEIALPTNVNDDYQGKSCGIIITVEAVQGNAATSDVTRPVYTIKTAEELKTLLTTLTSAGAGDNKVIITDDIEITEDWTPVSVDGYSGAGVITIEGNNHSIKGLNNPLLAGGFAGKSGVVINDLTLEDVNIEDSTSNLGIGAFVGCIDSMQKIELKNCHLKNSTIKSTGGARVGGLIGWTSGYDNLSDGPVDTYVTVKNCSVENCTITAKGSVGAIIGHAGSNAATYQTIEGCTVKNCMLNSTDDGGWRVGVVVGTANVGELTISGTTASGNTLSQTGKSAPADQSNLYGRFVPGTTGKLTIDGVSITA